MTEAVFYVCLWFGMFQNIHCADYGVPVIRQVDQAEWVKLRLGEGYDSASDRIKQYMGSNTRAVYSYADRTIYLRSDIKPNTVDGQATIAHEYIHYLQHVTGAYVLAPCDNALEPPAYQIQNEFLVQHGYEPARDARTMELGAKCGRL